MPYEAKADGDDYIVVNTETSEEKARHSPPDAKEKADRQVAILNEYEGDDEYDRGKRGGDDG